MFLASFLLSIKNKRNVMLVILTFYLEKKIKKAVFVLSACYLLINCTFMFICMSNVFL